MATIDFQVYATALGANVVTQPDYVAAAWRTAGFGNGIALPDEANKVWRQSAFVSAAIAQYISVQNGNADVLDNGDIAAFLAQLTAAISLGAAVKPARTVTSSATLVIALSDYALGFNRTAALAAMDAQLPDAQVGQEFVLEDIVGNFFAFPVRVLPPSGTIAGAPEYKMDQDKQSAKFRRYAGNLWSVAT